MNQRSHRYKPRNIIFDIGGVLFDMHKHARFLLNAGTIEFPTNPDEHIPIKEGIHILRQCHQATTPEGERLYKLFILSNWKSEGFEKFTSSFPEIFSLFDGIIISGMVGAKKPDPDIYKHLLTTYKLKPHECIFIDDYAANIQAAQELGIMGIECTDHQTVLKQLQKLGVIPKR